MIAKFLGVRVWALGKVAYHYIDEATTILEGRYDARRELCRQYKVSPEKVVLPDY